MRTASEFPDGPFPSQSILTIDLGAIADNYETLRTRAGRATCAAVVKADGYGLGITRVGAALSVAGCRDFFVAQLSEGSALRAALPPDARIYVLGGLFSGEETQYIRDNLIPVLNDPGQVELWSKAGRRAGHPFPAVIHLDTGMSRLGLTPSETRVLANDIGRLHGIDLRYWMSHLACADEPEHPLNRRQLEEIRGAVATLPKAPVSFANSSGIFLGPEYHFDLVRPGCALYGINPTPGQQNPMRQVVRVDAKVLQVRMIDHPETVGYGATHRAAGPMRVATIATGYADGWLRSLSSRGFGVVNGVKAPFIGRVSMDLITIDATSLPELRAGDSVELMGDNLNVDHVADLAGTIGYEVLTRLGPRFYRRYINEPADGRA